MLRPRYGRSHTDRQGRGRKAALLSAVATETVGKRAPGLHLKPKLLVRVVQQLEDRRCACVAAGAAVGTLRRPPP